jgi:hypothetical protein
MEATRIIGQSADDRTTKPSATASMLWSIVFKLEDIVTSLTG